MIESHNPQEVLDLPSNVLNMQRMISDEGFTRHALWLQEHRAGEYDAAVGHAARLQERAADIIEQSIENNGDYTDAVVRAEKIKRYTASTFGSAAVHEYRRSVDAEQGLSSFGGRIELWGDTAERTYSELINNSSVLDDGIDRTTEKAPVTEAPASREDYIHYLSKKQFINYNRLAGLSDKRTVRLIMEAGEQTAVPVQNVVSAFEFSSWAGRGFDGSGDKEYTSADGSVKKGQSIDAIASYAERSSPLPPAEGIDAFIQPDGTVLYAAEYSNHRTAAAIARGDTELAVAGAITFHLLKENVIPGSS